MTMANRLGAEFIDTFWLVLGGCGSAVLAGGFSDVGIGLLGVSLRLRADRPYDGLRRRSHLRMPLEPRRLRGALVRRPIPGLAT